MLHQELQNQFRGSFLKRQYLEAFAIQSAYIEGLIMLYYELSLAVELDDSTGSKKLLKQYIDVFDGRVGIAQVIKMLVGAEMLTKEEGKTLDGYRIKRNKTLHQLLAEFHRSEFEETLKQTYQIGDALIATEKFQIIASLVDDMEKYRRDPNPVNTNNGTDITREASVGYSEEGEVFNLGK